jgi:hypothetical protein
VQFLATESLLQKRLEKFILSSVNIQSVEYV